MKDTTTYKTARKLAAAGFPQPAPAPGQWWGDSESLVFVFRAWVDGKHDFFIVAQTVADGRPIIDDYFDARDFTGLVFLPTVGDILRELPDESTLQRWSVDGLFYLEAANGYDQFMHEHPAEAAALAYLDIHEKN